MVVNRIVSRDRQLLQPPMQEYATENHLIPMWFSSTPLTVIKVQTQESRFSTNIKSKAQILGPSWPLSVPLKFKDWDKAAASVKKYFLP